MNSACSQSLCENLSWLRGLSSSRSNLREVPLPCSLCFSKGSSKLCTGCPCLYSEVVGCKSTAITRQISCFRSDILFCTFGYLEPLGFETIFWNIFSKCLHTPVGETGDLQLASAPQGHKACFFFMSLKQRTGRGQVHPLHYPIPAG